MTKTIHTLDLFLDYFILKEKFSVEIAGLWTYKNTVVQLGKHLVYLTLTWIFLDLFNNVLYCILD